MDEIIRELLNLENSIQQDLESVEEEMKGQKENPVPQAKMQKGKN